MPLAKCVKVRVNFDNGGSVQYASTSEYNPPPIPGGMTGESTLASQEKTRASTQTILGRLLTSPIEVTVFARRSLVVRTGTTEEERPATPSTLRMPW